MRDSGKEPTGTLSERLGLLRRRIEDAEIPLLDDDQLRREIEERERKKQIDD
ncbi:MAG TPA: hypothetical protein VML01_02755 [Bryobacterales bacterium]|nr:hypothetical protein [Bryobacterales bacterium]